MRNATHAGSWYSDNKRKLSAELNKYMMNAKEDLDAEKLENHPRAIIVPHAGYSYCGQTAGYAWTCLDPSKFKRVFVLGPSHHAYLKGCALSANDVLETPLGNLIVDKEINEKLMATKKFSTMSSSVDEDEHSIEMQLPFLAQVLSKSGSIENHTVIPILVGDVDLKAEAQYGKLLSEYLKDEENLFVISSDFCHWGSRFQFNPYDETKGQIWQSIESMDREGMAFIEKQDHEGFYKYLKGCGNTICGRHPIGVLLGGLESLKGSNAFKVEFVHYSQSSKVVKSNDSSVSYASAIVAELL